jgi:hypothetical protein
MDADLQRALRVSAAESRRKELEVRQKELETSYLKVSGWGVTVEAKGKPAETLTSILKYGGTFTTMCAGAFLVYRAATWMSSTTDCALSSVVFRFKESESRSQEFRKTTESRIQEELLGVRVQFQWIDGIKRDDWVSLENVTVLWKSALHFFFYSDLGKIPNFVSTATEQMMLAKLDWVVVPAFLFFAIRRRTLNIVSQQELTIQLFAVLSRFWDIVSPRVNAWVVETLPSFLDCDINLSSLGAKRFPFEVRKYA